MPSYTYTAKDVTGNIRKGTLSAEDEQDFLAKIHEKGLFPTEYNEAAGLKQSTHKFSTKELEFNCRQMAAMLTSGLTLVKALDILSDVAVMVLGVVMMAVGWNYATTLGGRGFYVSMPWLSRFWMYFPVPLAGVAMIIFEIEALYNHIKSFFVKEEN